MIEQQYTACHWRVIRTNDSSVICMWHNEMVSGCFQDSWDEKQMKSSIGEAKRSSSSTDLPLDSISSIEFAWYLIECAEETKKLIRQTCTLNVRRKLAETLFFSFFLLFFVHSPPLGKLSISALENSALDFSRTCCASRDAFQLIRNCREFSVICLPSSISANRARKNLIA